MAKPTLNDSTITQLLQTRDYHLNEAKRIDDALDILRNVGRLAQKAIRITGSVRERATGIPSQQQQPSARAFAEQHMQRYSSPAEEARRLMALGEQQGFTFQKAAMLSALQLIRTQGGVRSQQYAKPHPDQPTGTQFVAQHANFKTSSVKQELHRLLKLSRSKGYHHNVAGLQAAYYAVRSGRTQVKPMPAKRSSSPAKKKKATGLLGMSRDARKRQLLKTGQSPIDRVRRFLLNGAGPGPFTSQELAAGGAIAEVMNPKFVPQAMARILQQMQTTREMKSTADGWVPLNVQQPRGPVQPHGEPTLPL